MPGVGEAWGREEACAVLLAAPVGSLRRGVAVTCAALAATPVARVLG